MVRSRNSSVKTAGRLLSTTVRSNPSKTKRHGHHSGSPARRAVSRGLSFKIVIAPTAMPGNSRRQRCTSARDASLLIQRDSPVRAAILPSSVVADFAAINGPPCVIQ